MCNPEMFGIGPFAMIGPGSDGVVEDCVSLGGIVRGPRLLLWNSGKAFL
jgi:hypothetical protein